MEISITKLKSLSSTALKKLVETEPAVVTSRSKPVVEVHKLSSTPTPPPDPDPGPGPNPPPPPPSGTKPSEMFGRNWTIMAPFNKPGATNSPENLYLSKAEADSRYAAVLYAKNGGWAFKTRADGVHSANSKYPRTELREMKDENWEEAAWSNKSGTHTLTGRYSVFMSLIKRPQVVLAQIHDDSDDVMQVAYDDGKLVAFYDDKAKVITLEPNYQGGTFDIQIMASNSEIRVYYNGAMKGVIPKSGDGWYFKAGTYLQSNVADWSEAPDAYGEVTIYSLKVSHS